MYTVTVKSLASGKTVAVEGGISSLSELYQVTDRLSDLYAEGYDVVVDLAGE